VTYPCVNPLGHFDPPFNFRLFPGDRLVLLGNPEGLNKALHILEERQLNNQQQHSFQMAEVSAVDQLGWTGNSLADLHLRRQHAVSLLGIQRGEKRIISPRPDEVIQSGDILLVIGASESIEALQKLNQPTG